MKFDFSTNQPQNFDDASSRFNKIISNSLFRFSRQYTPYLGNAMTQIVSRFDDDPISNFELLVGGVSEELERIKEDAKEGKSDNPLADVKGVCSFQFAVYCRCHAPNAQRSIYWPMNTIFSRTSLWIQTTTMLGGEAGLLVL